MKTIWDTNIWRSIVEKEIGKEDLLKVESPLALTFINIDEIVKSNLIISDIEKAKLVVQCMMEMPSQNIFDPPIVYLKKLDNVNYEFNSAKKHQDIFNFTRGIANGKTVIKSDFEKYKKERDDSIIGFCDFINTESKLINGRIDNAKNHRKINTIKINRELISFMVQSQTGAPLSNSFDWTKIELFENVLSLFFKELETTKMKMKINDVYDLFILIYVQPNDKIWTIDKRKGPLKYVSGIQNGKYILN